MALRAMPEKAFRFRILRAAVGVITVIAWIVPFQQVQARQVSSAVWLPAGDSNPGQSAQVIAVKNDALSAEFRAELPGVWALPAADGSSTQIWAQGRRAEDGRLPTLSWTVEAPPGAAVKLEVLSASVKRVDLSALGLPAALQPAAAPACKCANPGEATSAPSAPAQPVAQISADYIQRGRRILLVTINLAALDSASQNLLLYSSIDARVSFDRAANSLQPYASLPGISAPIDQPLPSDSSLMLASPQTVAKGYLIIAPDAYLPSLQPLAALKGAAGYSVRLAGLSQTGYTSDAIRGYITALYKAANPPLAYVLLVGMPDNGVDTLPAFIGSATQSATDLYYAAVDGADWIPDLLVGRVPARSIQQVDSYVMREKIFAALTGKEDWLREASFLATCDPSYAATVEQDQVSAIQKYTLPDGYIGDFPSSPEKGGDRLFCVSNKAGFDAVQNALATGRGLIVYSGHGTPTGWEMGVSTTSLPQIAGSTATPVIFSFACQTADININNSLGEAWINTAGALSFIGASASTFWFPDSDLEDALLGKLFSSPSGQTLSASLQAGLLDVDQQVPEMSRYYHEVYNLLGDPSLTLSPLPQTGAQSGVVYSVWLPDIIH